MDLLGDFVEGRDRVIFCFLLPCVAACFVVYVLAVGCAGWMGKGIAFAGFFGSIRKRRKLYMFLVVLSLSFFERLFWLLWRVVGGLGPLKFVGKKGTFLYFWARKGLCLWSYGGLEQWYFLYLLCYFFSFLSHLSILNCA